MLSTKSDIPLTPDCGFYNAHKLMKAGCNVWMYTRGFHHTKIIMVDGKFCTVGSANLNARSLRWDYEENAVIVDSCTTQQLVQLLMEKRKTVSYSMRRTGESGVRAGKDSKDGLQQRYSLHSCKTRYKYNPTFTSRSKTNRDE